MTVYQRTARVAILHSIAAVAGLELEALEEPYAFCALVQLKAGPLSRQRRGLGILGLAD
jgi:hypothetical protein